MHSNIRKPILLIYLTALSTLAACTGADSKQPEKGVECNEVTIESETYCVYEEPIQETGFACPQEMPHRQNMGGGTVCSSREQIPPEHEERIKNHPDSGLSDVNNGTDPDVTETDDSPGDTEDPSDASDGESECGPEPDWLCCDATTPPEPPTCTDTGWECEFGQERVEDSIDCPVDSDVQDPPVDSTDNSPPDGQDSNNETDETQSSLPNWIRIHVKEGDLETDGNAVSENRAGSNDPQGYELDTVAISNGVEGIKPDRVFVYSKELVGGDRVSSPVDALQKVESGHPDALLFTGDPGQNGGIVDASGQRLGDQNQTLEDIRNKVVEIPSFILHRQETPLPNSYCDDWGANLDPDGQLTGGPQRDQTDGRNYDGDSLPDTWGDLPSIRQQILTAGADQIIAIKLEEPIPEEGYNIELTRPQKTNVSPEDDIVESNHGRICGPSGSATLRIGDGENFNEAIPSAEASPPGSQKSGFHENTRIDIRDGCNNVSSREACWDFP